MPIGVYKRNSKMTTGKYTRTPEQRKKISEWNLKFGRKGSDCNFYKDGRDNNKEYRNWRKNKRNRLKKATIKELGSHTYGEWELLKKQYNS